MMSSVIPARLTFKCGHAALVTLPRVKGETSAQRNQRVAREKSDALLRQCDFCGPEVEVAVASNGSHVAVVSDVLEAEPIVVSEAPTATEPVMEEAVAPVETVLVEPTSTRPMVNGAPHPKRAQRRTAVVTGQSYVVAYQIQRVVRAADIRDALRQAAAMGTGELLGITRED
jgi:hypothetical protein